jgi:hypothetical protein
MGSIHPLHITSFIPLLVAALLQWFLGAIWYSPALFAKPWMRLLAITPDPSKRKTMVYGMIASFIGDLVTALVLWHFVTWAGADTFGAGAFVGFLAWLGLVAAPLMAQNIYEGRRFGLFAINTGYWLLCLLAVGGLLAVWR